MKLILLLSSLSAILLFSGYRPYGHSQLKKDGYVFVQSGNFEMFDDQSVKNGFYISSTEITNAQYREFLSDLRKENKTGEIIIASIDSLGWNDALNYSLPYVTYYHNHPAYREYPVVNVSYEGAKLYCIWLTEKYQRMGLNVKVELPTEYEWVFAACAGNPDNKYGWEGNEIKTKKNGNSGNFDLDQMGVGVLLAHVRSFKPNAFGLYNMSGNAAEMLLTSGHHKGGCWTSAAAHVEVYAPDQFAGLIEGSPYIGFRPVIKILSLSHQ